MAANVPLMSVIDKVSTTAPELKLIKNVNKNTIAVDGNNIADKSLIYSLTMRNEGNASAVGTIVNIEGANLTKVVFEDTLPQGTVLNSLNYRSGGGGRTLLYHVRGTPEKLIKTMS